MTTYETNRFFDVAAQPVLSDTVDLPYVSRGVEIYAAGNIRVLMAGGGEDTVTIPAAAVPYLFPRNVRRIFATGTTIAASNLRIGC